MTAVAGATITHRQCAARGCPLSGCEAGLQRSWLLCISADVYAPDNILLQQQCWHHAYSSCPCCCTCHVYCYQHSTAPHSLDSCLQEWRVIAQLPLYHMLEGLLHLLAAQHIRSRVKMPALLLLLESCARQVQACAVCIASCTCCSKLHSQLSA